ncbi:MAG TPA: GreA/GreB family elongation factor [Candidatus Sulfotelmatobacter sp.]|nr:GreA/GreB family elongation factor [Candidatus Sulfotelmatobacter sp.]
MSRAFVKENEDGPSGDQLPDLPISPHPNYVTASGLRKLEARRAAFKEERAKLDAGGGDLTQASHIARLEQEIRYLDARIASAIPVDLKAIDRGEVHVGARVTVQDGQGATHHYDIVGEDEADADGLISWVSPLAKALMGARVDDHVVWKRPRGDVELDIIEIAYPEA